jgi:dienelactone hydrolase
MAQSGAAGDEAYQAVGCCHPAFFGKEQEFAAAAKAPACILPAEGDTDLAKAKAEFGKKPFADKCVYRRFDDQVHGFLAARGDYSKPEVADAAGEGIAILVDFFNKCILP